MSKLEKTIHPAVWNDGLMRVRFRDSIKLVARRHHPGPWRDSYAYKIVVVPRAAAGTGTAIRNFNSLSSLENWISKNFNHRSNLLSGLKEFRTECAMLALSV
jgi:hypothetical protein